MLAAISLTCVCDRRNAQISLTGVGSDGLFPSTFDFAESTRLDSGENQIRLTLSRGSAVLRQNEDLDLGSIHRETSGK
jgi:hypothetical protein